MIRTRQSNLPFSNIWSGTIQSEKLPVVNGVVLCYTVLVSKNSSQRKEIGKMTRKRFNGLRLELCRRIYAMDCNADKKFNPRSLRDLRPDFTKVGSYAEAWEMLKPARDCVGM